MTDCSRDVHFSFPPTHYDVITESHSSLTMFHNVLGSPELSLGLTEGEGCCRLMQSFSLILIFPSDNHKDTLVKGELITCGEAVTSGLWRAFYVHMDSVSTTKSPDKMWSQRQHANVATKGVSSIR